MMGALIRALTNNAVENIEEALGMTDATSSAMKHAIAEWYAAWYGRAPTKTEDPCQRLPYAIVNKLCKATFGEYDSGLQHTDSAKGKYIPAGTRREALQQLAFAIGAVVDCSRGEIIRIVPAPQRASGLIGTDRRLQDGSKVTLLALVTAVSVTAHRYIPGEASEELYKDTLEPGTYRVTFDAPAVADSLAVRGAELSERGVNHCTLTVSKAAEVCVTGRKYSDSATVLRREASNLPSNAQGNEVSVPDATLVSPDRAAAVAARVLDYYAQRYEQTFRMVAGDEKLADRLIVESFGGEMVRGVVTKLEFDLTGGFLADAKIVGRKLSNNAAAYAGEEIHAGERSFI